MKEAQRVDFLDGLRGIAALQVVGLHYCTAFLPAIGLLHSIQTSDKSDPWVIHAPAFFVIDGYASVYVFFLISGAALTYSYSSQPYAIGVGLGRRLVRLGLPMAASILLAAFLFWLFAGAHVVAGEMTGSVSWLAIIGPHNIGLWSVLKEVTFYSLLTGYTGPQTTLWPAYLLTAWHVPSTATSFNAPLWTLHFEFYGSLLVLILVAIRSLAGRVFHLAVCFLLLAFLGTHPLSLFVIGHLIAPLLMSPRWHALTRRGPVQIAGIAAFICGVAVSSHSGWHWLANLSSAYTTHVGLPGVLDLFHTQSLLEAMLLFSGVIMVAPAQRALNSQLARWFGRISFSLYLTHFSILLTFTSAVLVDLGGTLIAKVLTVILGVGFSLIVAALFEKGVDRPAIYLSRRIGRLTVKPATQMTRNIAPISVMDRG